jgi:hypothetical protein
MLSLLEAVRSLGEIEITNLSRILIAPRNGEIVATFSISANLPHAADGNLPTGVSLLGWERWPDQERVIDWRADLGTQIRELERAGIVGRLDTHHKGSDSWAITTHAGSDKERHAWVFRNENPCPAKQ